jgi:hypothetical protein
MSRLHLLTPLAITLLVSFPARAQEAQRVPPLPLPPLLTPMPGCWARLISIEGCAGCEVEPLGAPDTPTPVEAGGVTTELLPVMPVLPAPTGAPAPAEPDVWAWAIETTEATHTRAVAKVLIILIPPRVELRGSQWWPTAYGKRSGAA